MCLNAIPGTFLRFFPPISTSGNESMTSNQRTQTNQQAHWSQSNQWNQIRNPWNEGWICVLNKVATTETSGWRREGAATQSWMNTSRIWHRKRDNWSDRTQTCCFGAKTRSKQRDFQSASARNMAFCWQAICSKPNLVNMLLFHDTIHQTHPNSCKTHHLQKAPEVSRCQPWQLDIPTSF